MTDPSSASAARDAVLHLLDSALGHPVQSWRFTDSDRITIGRNDDCDVAIADPHVSRAHATLTFKDGEWILSSTGRHGTLVNDRVVTDVAIGNRTIFRLGSGGPMLRFDTERAQQRHGETMDSINPEMFDMLAIDESRKQEEVAQIIGNQLFRDLREESLRLRAMKPDDTESP